MFVGIEDNKPIIRVSDTGIGIPKDQCSRIFERFYRVDKSHSRKIGGTGLGLSIVKHGAAFHNAHIEVNSKPGEGTVFTAVSYTHLDALIATAVVLFVFILIINVCFSLVKRRNG